MKSANGKLNVHGIYLMIDSNGCSFNVENIRLYFLWFLSVLYIANNEAYALKTKPNQTWRLVYNYKKFISHVSRGREVQF